MHRAAAIFCCSLIALFLSAHSLVMAESVLPHVLHPSAAWAGYWPTAMSSHAVVMNDSLFALDGTNSADLRMLDVYTAVPRLCLLDDDANVAQWWPLLNTALASSLIVTAAQTVWIAALAVPYQNVLLLLDLKSGQTVLRLNVSAAQRPAQALAADADSNAFWLATDSAMSVYNQQGRRIDTWTVPTAAGGAGDWLVAITGSEGALETLWLLGAQPLSSPRSATTLLQLDLQGFVITSAVVPVPLSANDGWLLHFQPRQQEDGSLLFHFTSSRWLSVGPLDVQSFYSNGSAGPSFASALPLWVQQPDRVATALSFHINTRGLHVFNSLRLQSATMTQLSAQDGSLQRLYYTTPAPLCTVRDFLQPWRRNDSFFVLESSGSFQRRVGVWLHVSNGSRMADVLLPSFQYAVGGADLDQRDILYVSAVTAGTGSFIARYAGPRLLSNFSTAFYGNVRIDSGTQLLYLVNRDQTAAGDSRLQLAVYDLSGQLQRLLFLDASVPTTPSPYWPRLVHDAAGTTKILALDEITPRLIFTDLNGNFSNAVYFLSGNAVTGADVWKATLYVSLDLSRSRVATADAVWVRTSSGLVRLQLDAKWALLKGARSSVCNVKVWRDGSVMATNRGSAVWRWPPLQSLSQTAES